MRDGNEVSQHCGRQDFSKLISELEELDELIILLRQTADDFMDLVDCPTLVPIYTSSGMCHKTDSISVHYCSLLTPV